jgi:3-hydroxyacyl-CoA dehydrogenase
MIATAPRLSEPMTRALLMLAAHPGQVANLHRSVRKGLARRGMLGPTYMLTEVGQDLAASLLEVAELVAELNHEPSSTPVIHSSWSDRHAAIVTRVVRRGSQPIARFEMHSTVSEATASTTRR